MICRRIRLWRRVVPVDQVLSLYITNSYLNTWIWSSAYRRNIKNNNGGTTVGACMRFVFGLLIALVPASVAAQAPDNGPDKTTSPSASVPAASPSGQEAPPPPSSVKARVRSRFPSPQTHEMRHRPHSFPRCTRSGSTPIQASYVKGLQSHVLSECSRRDTPSSGGGGQSSLSGARRPTEFVA